MTSMTPISQCPPESLRQIRGVLTDIDDTLTTEGDITADALQALRDLKAAGLKVIAITGRPIAWSEPFSRKCPLDAVVAENGAVAWVKSAPKTQISSALAQVSPHSLHSLLSKIYCDCATTRAENWQRLQACLDDVEANVPGAHRAQDSAGRETDIAIDHSEFTQLGAEQIEAVAQRMRSHGLNATVSSIHINGWIGPHNKLSGARWILRELYGAELDAELKRWLYVGDSSNDQAMFEALPLSVGVANIARFLPRLTHKPSFVTRAERGAGFAEMVQVILQARKLAR